MAYNTKYKKGMFKGGSLKAQKADWSKTSKRNLLENTPANKRLWESDTRKYDLMGVDTRKEAEGKKLFKYLYTGGYRSGKLTPLKGKTRKSYRRYYYGKRDKTVYGFKGRKRR